jgi:hypothetical protein
MNIGSSDLIRHRQQPAKLMVSSLVNTLSANPHHCRHLIGPEVVSRSARAPDPARARSGRRTSSVRSPGSPTRLRARIHVASSEHDVGAIGGRPIRLTGRRPTAKVLARIDRRTIAAISRAMRARFKRTFAAPNRADAGQWPAPTPRVLRHLPQLTPAPRAPRSFQARH